MQGQKFNTLVIDSIILSPRFKRINTLLVTSLEDKILKWNFDVNLSRHLNEEITFSLH